MLAFERRHQHPAGPCVAPTWERVADVTRLVLRISQLEICGGRDRPDPVRQGEGGH